MKLVEIWLCDPQKAYDLQMSFPMNENGFENRVAGKDFVDFVNYVHECKEHSEGKNLLPGYVPSTVYVLEDEDRYVGLFNFRHELTDFLKTGPGHVGYGIRKEFRQKGYAVKGLQLLKKIAKARGITELYLSCYVDNIASLKTQLRCGAYIYKREGGHYLTRIPLKREITVMVACHKKSDTPDDSMYLPIQAGAALREKIGYVGDDSGENISVLNGRYCELSTLYWCRHNLESAVFGLVHYRRYFLSPTRKRSKSVLADALKGHEVNELMTRYKVIVPKKRHYYIQTLYQHYSDTFTCEHLTKTREILTEIAPQYISSFDEVLRKRSGYMFNMFVMNSEDTARYCDWLFPILRELDSRVDSSAYDAFAKRYLGRVGERLWNVWLHRQLKEGHFRETDIIELPYAYLGKVKWLRKISGFILAKFLKKKYKESF